ncbi:MAG: mechanosensitive ion channel [Acidobacteria bacterium]|nr:mechanosensitive ion channel [Acidobacteriota bacterium]
MHPHIHFYWTIAFLSVTAGLLAVVRTRILRRRLLVAVSAFLFSIGLHFLIVEDQRFSTTHRIADQGPPIEYLLAAFGVIGALVALALNPWRRERAEVGVPAIVQDALVALFTLGAALFFLQNSTFLVGVTGSAIVLGLALQETIGNAFAGLALQIERPFRVGHWVTAAGHEGRIVEVTWRATKIRTKSGNLVVLPNSEVAKAAITNYSEPAAPFRLEVVVGLGYETPPNAARDALLAAVRRVPRVLTTPAPEILLWDFAPSSVSYTIWFWTDDYEKYELVQSDVRRAIYYELGRRRIEIPYPIQVEYSRETRQVDTAARIDDALRMVATVPAFSALPMEAQRALAEVTTERLFADGEAIVTEGDAGDSMYFVRRGRVVVAIGAERRRVAVTDAGGYFGEMSLLTGDPRTATVIADGDCVLLELDADDFRSYVQSHPAVLDQLASAALLRRKALDDTKTIDAGGPQEQRSLLQRMQRFFGIRS